MFGFFILIRYISVIDVLIINSPVKEDSREMRDTIAIIASIIGGFCIICIVPISILVCCHYIQRTNITPKLKRKKDSNTKSKSSKQHQSSVNQSADDEKERLLSSSPNSKGNRVSFDQSSTDSTTYEPTAAASLKEMKNYNNNTEIV